jgi:hypothetical protein
MAKVDIRWNKEGFYKLRSEPGVQKALDKWAAKVAANANRMSGLKDSFKTSSRQGARRPQGRWRTTVITADAQAMRNNAKNQTLTKALYSTTGESFSGG